MKTTIYLLALLCSFTAYSQTASKSMTFKKGPALEAKGTNVKSVVGQFGDGYVVVREDKEGTKLERLNASMKVIKSADLTDVKINDLKKTSYSSSIHWGDRMFLIFIANDKKADLLRYVVDEYDPTTLTMKKRIHTGKTVFSGLRSIYMNGIGMGDALSETSELIGADFSSNSDYLVLYTSQFDKHKSEKEQVTFEVFDQSMNLVWTQANELPYAQDDFTIEDVVADDNGNVHLLGYEYLSRAEAKAEDLKGQLRKYHVISYYKDGTSKEYEMTLKDYSLREVSIEINAEGNLIACGYYAPAGTSTIIGAFFSKVDLNTRTVLLSNEQKFNFDVSEGVDEDDKESDDDAKPQAEVKSKKEEKKEAKKKGIFSLRLNHFKMMEDGGVIMVGEQFYTYTVTTTSTVNGSTTTQTRTVFVYGSLVVNRVNAAGQILWSTKIPKLQSSSSATEYLSYAITLCNDKIYLLFNDHAKNQAGEKVFRYGGPFGKYGVVSLVVVGADGAFTRELVVPHSEDNVALVPSSSLSASDCELLCFFKTRKEYQFFLGTAVK